MKKMLRKLCALSLVLFLVLINISTYGYAAEYSENIKEEQINGLLAKLNNLAVQEEVYNSAVDRTAYSTEEVKAYHTLVSNEKEQINEQLERLGMKLVDPNDSETITELSTIIYQAEANKLGKSPNLRNTSTSLDFSRLATLYDVRESEGTYTVDGESYDTVHIVVTHNAGKNGRKLYETETCTLLIDFPQNTVLEDLLEYSFEFAVDELYGQLPWRQRWLIGAYFACQDNQTGQEVVSRNGNVYDMDLDSTVSLNFYYMYLPGLQSWVQIGSSLNNLAILREDAFRYSVGSNPCRQNHEFDLENMRLSTSRSVRWYVTTYLEEEIDYSFSLGTFEVSCCDHDDLPTGLSVEYTPPHYDLISRLY